LAASLRSLEQPVGDFRAYVDFISDSDFVGLTPEELISAHSPESQRSFAFIIDQTALLAPDNLILVFRLGQAARTDFSGHSVRGVGRENNLSLGNMGFTEFADAVDPDGVFRGFPQTRSRSGKVHCHQATVPSAFIATCIQVKMNGMTTQFGG
jgi:hypothetical protein